MTYYIVNGLGDSIDQPSPEQMRRFLEDVDASDEEHGAAWLSTDGGLSLEWNGDGRLVFSSRPNPVRHLLHVSREKTLQLWQALVQDRVAEVEAEAWQPGNGIILTDERKRQLENLWQRQQDRSFYEALGEERAEVPCREPGCKRGAISLGVLCRVHHFEMVQKRPCPFSD